VIAPVYFLGSKRKARRTGTHRPSWTRGTTGRRRSHGLSWPKRRQGRHGPLGITCEWL